MTLPPLLNFALSNPDLALDELDRVDSEASLLDFIAAFWRVLEPSRPFVRGRVLEVICEHLEAITSGQIRKLLINVPPGCMKSLTTNVFWPAWEWGPKNMPWVRYIHASYSLDLMLRDNRRCRQLIADPRYRTFWGKNFGIAPDQDAKGKFENDKRGWKIATSVGGHVVGERGDRFIIDDPHNIKTAESTAIRESALQWFTEVVPTRVNDPDQAAFVVIMQRVHERDVSGLILANDLGYDYLCLPMEYEEDHPTPSRSSLGFRDWRTEPGELLWPERFTPKAVTDLKNQLRAWGGSYAEVGQLQQRPAPRGGGMFKAEWWRFFATEATRYNTAARPIGCADVTAVDAPKTFDWTLLSIDAAFKNTGGSRVSIQVIAGRGPYRFVLDNFTAFLTFTETVHKILELRDKWRPTRILVEDKANGSAIIDMLRQKVSGVVAINPEGGKESRASAVQPMIESGHVLLPDGAPWLIDYISEFATFPAGSHDDQVDALSQALIYMTANVDVARAIALAKW